MRNFFKNKYYLIFFPLVISSIISLFTESSLNSLVLPPYMPPGYVFPIVWTILYLLMGISLYMVKNSNKCIVSFVIQFFFNITWTIIFFNLEYFGLAVIWTMALIFFVNNMLLTYVLVNKKAAYLNLPYFIWLLIAFYLTVGIYILN